MTGTPKIRVQVREVTREIRACRVRSARDPRVQSKKGRRLLLINELKRAGFSETRENNAKLSVDGGR